MGPISLVPGRSFAYACNHGVLTQTTKSLLQLKYRRIQAIIKKDIYCDKEKKKKTYWLFECIRLWSIVIFGFK